jgi:hypothetical protein
MLKAIKFYCFLVLLKIAAILVILYEKKFKIIFFHCVKIVEQ